MDKVSEKMKLSILKVLKNMNDKMNNLMGFV